MTASPKTVRPRGRPLRDVPIEPEVMRRPAKQAPESAPRAPAKTPKKRSPWVTVLTVLMLLSIAVLLFWLVAGLFGSMVKLKTVTVVWPDGPSALVSDAAVTAAADLRVGEGLYTIPTAEVEAAILRANPYLASVEVKREWPDAVIITCTDRSAAYYLEADGEYFALDCNLTALEQSREVGEFAGRGLVHLILPEPRQVLIGEPLVFADDFDAGYLPPLLEAHRASGLYGDTDVLRIESRFDVRLVVRGSYALTLGESTDAALKLSLAEKILADELFARDTGAFLNLSNPAESSAILDKATDYSLLWRD